MNAQKFQIIGLTGLIVAGFFFIVSALGQEDMFALAGSVVWTIACAIWLMPLIRWRK